MKGNELERWRGAVVYLIHLERPYSDAQGHKTARHYIGFSVDLASRMGYHRSGTGARFLAAVNAAGITYHVARIWTQGACRTLERRIKGYKQAAYLCPVCSPDRWFYRAKDGATMEETNAHE